jgi:hypothetical protein
MSDFVSVPVPIERVAEVYELLARQTARPSIGHHVTADGYPEGWNEPLVDRMFIESSSALRRILFAIAQRSPGWVTTKDIAGSSGLTPRQVVASLGPFGKRLRGRYGMRVWPFEAREFVDAGVLKYSMPSGAASRIIALMAQEEME